MLAVSISGLKKSYGKITALKGIDLEVPVGSIYGLIGPNGAGKTTLIKSLVGALRPDSGTIRVSGLDPLKDRWKLRKQIGYMPQAAGIYESLSARDNISFFGKARRIGNLRERIGEILKFTELEDRADDPVYSFSGGMKKRVSLACALIHEPKILFLDEPTAAVDPLLKLRSWQMFRNLSQQGATLFISTHIIDEARLCDRITVLRNGEIITVDSPQKILERGKTVIKICEDGKEREITIESKPEALAGALQNFGMDKQIQSISIHSENLEEIILSIIRQLPDKEKGI